MTLYELRRSYDDPLPLKLYDGKTQGHKVAYHSLG
jgi:hypothetical protein